MNFTVYSAHSIARNQQPLKHNRLYPKKKKKGNFGICRQKACCDLFYNPKIQVHNHMRSSRRVTKSWVGSDICKYKGFFCDNPPDNLSAIAVASIDFKGLDPDAWCRNLEHLLFWPTLFSTVVVTVLKG